MDLGNIDWSKLGIDPADIKSDESPEVDVAQIESAHPALRSRLRVRLERKGRGGKMATVLTGLRVPTGNCFRWPLRSKPVWA